MRLEWSKRAGRDLENIFRYYWRVASRQLADEAEAAIVSRAIALTRVKLVYRRGRGDTRECVMRRFPFIIIYRIDSQAVRIVRLLHQAREYFNR